MTDKTLLTWVVVWFFIFTTAYCAVAMPHNSKRNLHRVTGDINIRQATAEAMERDKCIPPEIKAVFGGMTTIIRISQYVFMTSNFVAAMFFDYDGEKVVLITVHQLDSNGHLIVWTRPDCGAV